MKLVINSGNGAAGHVIDELEKRFNALSVPLEIIKVHHEGDGNFPNGIPHPLLPECRADTANAVKNTKPIWELHLMVTLTAASCLMKTVILLEVTTS